MFKRIAPVVLFSLLLIPLGGWVKPGRSIPPVASPSSFTAAWQDLQLGGGGNITQIARATSDGTTVIATDTYGGYLYRPTGTCKYGTTQTFAAPCWEQLFTQTSLGALGNVNTTNLTNMAAAEVEVCNSNTNVGYAIYNDLVLVTTNLQSVNRTWTNTGQSTNGFNGNSGPKANGRFLACDLNNPDVLYVATITNGVLRTTNGRAGASAVFSAVPTVLGSGSGNLIAIDPTSSTTTCGGVTCSTHVMICTPGTGCYISTNASTWALTASTPTTPVHLIADKFGQFWVTTSSALEKFAASAWTIPTIPGGGFDVQAVATDPASSAVGTNHVVFSSSSGQVASSSDNGATWTPAFCCADLTYNATGAQPGWLGAANYGGLGGVGSTSNNTNDIVFDGSSNVWQAAGVGVWTANAPVSGSSLTWAANSVGIEQLVVQNVISPPNISPLTNVWDRGVFTNINPDAFPALQYIDAAQSTSAISVIQGGWRADWAGTSGFITACVSSNLDSSAVPASSTDGGRTWTQWASLGVVAALATDSCQVWAASSSNWLMLPVPSNFGGALAFTSNTATSWTATTAIGGAPAFNTGSFGPTDFANRVFGAADRVNGKFYVVDNNTIATRNFYVSSNGGSSFSAGAAAAADGTPYRDQLMSVPGQANNVFYTAGGGQQGSHPFSNHLWKSTDGALTFNKVPASGALQEPIAVGFGAAKPGGGGYPMVYAYGWLSSVQGMYASADGGTTWALINTPASEQVWPMNSIDLITSVSGDNNVYGRIYVGFVGSGAAYIDTQDACPWVNWSNAKPTQNFTGTVTLTAQHSGLVPVSTVTFKVDGATIASFSGTQASYSFSWVTGSVLIGAHTLSVVSTGNSCGANSTFTIPITTS